MCRVFNRFFFVLVSTEVSASVSGSHHIFTAEGKITSLLKQQQKKKRVFIKCHYYYCGFPSFPFFFLLLVLCLAFNVTSERFLFNKSKERKKKKLLLCVCLLLSCAPTQVSGIRKGKQDCFLFFFFYRLASRSYLKYVVVQRLSVDRGKSKKKKIKPLMPFNCPLSFSLTFFFLFFFCSVYHNFCVCVFEHFWMRAGG